MYFGYVRNPLKLSCSVAFVIREAEGVLYRDGFLVVLDFLTIRYPFPFQKSADLHAVFSFKSDLSYIDPPVYVILQNSYAGEGGGRADIAWEDRTGRD
jgi:hypothetical protein